MQVDHTKNIIELHNVSFSYGDEEVLKNVDLNIHKGDYMGIIGPNGGGKTTLLKIMLGLIKPDKGTVKLFGQDLQKFRDWSKIAYVQQKATNFDPAFPITVQEVVEMGRYGKKGLFKRLGTEDRKMILDAIEEVGLTEDRHTVMGRLSGGQQQRVFIARALASHPEVIFLDEPTIGVDIQIQDQFYKLLQKLNRKYELTLVLVSHDINVVANEVTEIAYVNKTLLYEDNPKDFLKNEGLKKIYGDQVKFILHNH
jgi:zinc transport system ATP-binding protein